MLMYLLHSVRWGDCTPNPTLRAAPCAVHCRGFSLIEMSIVLVIIGLIVGGILAGQSMMQAAKLDSVISAVTKYKTAVDTFKTKYEQLPGDMVDAHDNWDNGSDTICGTAAQCNGDGSGLFERVSANENEKLRAWQHLILADLIPGNLIGYESTANDEEMDVNVPDSQIEGGGFRFDTISSVNTLNFAGDLGDPGLLQDGILQAADAARIDTKADDGVADTGFITSVNGSGDTGCVVNPGTNDDYDHDNTNNACQMYFWIFD